LVSALCQYWPLKGRKTGHTKIESTVRYLGIEVDDALVVEQVDVKITPGRADMPCPLL
jgi:hypothetical protein